LARLENLLSRGCALFTSLGSPGGMTSASAQWWRQGTDRVFMVQAQNVRGWHRPAAGSRPARTFLDACAANSSKRPHRNRGRAALERAVLTAMCTDGIMSRSMSSGSSPGSSSEPNREIVWPAALRVEALPREDEGTRLRISEVLGGSSARSHMASRRKYDGGRDIEGVPEVQAAILEGALQLVASMLVPARCVGSH